VPNNTTPLCHPHPAAGAPARAHPYVYHGPLYNSICSSSNFLEQRQLGAVVPGVYLRAHDVPEELGVWQQQQQLV